jgi:hypothetical protein
VFATKSDAAFDRSQALARHLGVPLTDEVGRSSRWVLAYKDGRLVLHDAQDDKSHPRCWLPCLMMQSLPARPIQNYQGHCVDA